MRFGAITALFLAATPLHAEGEAAGDFDYYVMALSWSPAWCAGEGAGRGAAQCVAGARFVLHGLWPQNEQGWPSYCRTGMRDPSRAESAAMADVMGSGGSAWYQWKKHGRCSGLPARGYYALARAAYGRIAIPEVFTRLQKEVRLPAAVVEEAFIEANPGLELDMVTVTCDRRRIDEVRICLSKALEPRPCAPDARRDCQMTDALMAPPR